MKGWWRWLIPGIILVLWMALLFANLFCNNLPEFYKASANSLLSSLIVISVSYWLVQARIDGRKTDDVVTNILNRAENSYKEYCTQVNCMMDSIEGDSVPAINSERQKMLSAKQKLDSHLDLLGKMRSEKMYQKDFKSLKSLVKTYHEKVETLSVSQNYSIPVDQKNAILRCSNLVNTKFAALYVRINHH